MKGKINVIPIDPDKSLDLKDIPEVEPSEEGPDLEELNNPESENVKGALKSI
jgi:hypothetical protein